MKRSFSAREVIILMFIYRGEHDSLKLLQIDDSLLGGFDTITLLMMDSFIDFGHLETNKHMLFLTERGELAVSSILSSSSRSIVFNP